jgi:hypothetical protein
MDEAVGAAAAPGFAMDFCKIVSIPQTRLQARPWAAMQRSAFLQAGVRCSRHPLNIRSAIRTN